MSGRVLAHRMLDFNIDGLRVLEVGCGIGLTSLVLRHRDADITATDRHPEVAGFLDINTRLNELEPIPYHQCDWQHESDLLG